MENRHVGMPQMKRKKPLREIINRHEVIALLKACKLDKHKIAIALAYGSGLRISEVVSLQVKDIDVIRQTVHVRDGKGGYDRFVPISTDFIRGYTNYKYKEQLINYVFRGKSKGHHLSVGGLQHALCTARRKAGIVKKISMHNLRHSYAVHFLEDTGDLLKLKQYLGHRDIKNTMHYLKYVQHMPQSHAYSPLTKVFDLARQNKSC